MLYLNYTKYITKVTRFHITITKVDWAGFEPAIFRLRIEHSYQAEPPALTDHVSFVGFYTAFASILFFYLVVII